MKHQQEPKQVSDQEIDAIIAANWNDNLPISVNLRLIASASISYGQRRLLAEGWQRFYG